MKDNKRIKFSWQWGRGMKMSVPYSKYLIWSISTVILVAGLLLGISVGAEKLSHAYCTIKPCNLEKIEVGK